MRNTPFDARSSEWIGDMTVWLRENSEDNGLCLERLRRNLRLAREQELTPCQRQVLDSTTTKTCPSRRSPGIWASIPPPSPGPCGGPRIGCGGICSIHYNSS